MLAEKNTLSLYIIHMTSWFVGKVDTKEVFTIATVVVGGIEEGVAIVAVDVMEQCSFSNNIMVKKYNCMLVAGQDINTFNAQCYGFQEWGHIDFNIPNNNNNDQRQGKVCGNWNFVSS